MTKNKKKEVQNVIVRVPIELHKKMDKISEDEVRSVNNLILYFIKKGLEEYAKNN